jgi:hypothetical protein
MTTTETRGPALAKTNGTTTKTRTRKPLTARAVASKVADLLEKLPTEHREKALALAKTMIEAGA